MDIREQTRWKWGHCEKQSNISCLRILIDRGDWLWKDICTHNKLTIGDDWFLESVDILSHSHRWCQCWCYANWIHVRLASLESNRLLPYTKGCPNRWSSHTPPKLKSEISKDESYYFWWLCTNVPFSCCSRGFYKADGTIITADCAFMSFLRLWLPSGQINYKP